MKKTVWMFVCAALLSLAAGASAADRLEIVASAANLRAEPDNAATVVTSAPKGAIVLIIEQQGAWYKVQHNGREGWIYNSSKLVRPARVNAGEIFTKHDASMLPPVPGHDYANEEPLAPKYARVLVDNTKIMERMDPQSPYIHMARRGDVFRLVGEGGTSFSLVVCKDTLGWVRNSNIEILDTKPTTSIAVSDAKGWLTGVLVCGAVILIAIGIITYRHIQIERKRNIYVQKNILILAKETKLVQSTFTNEAKTIERCFTEVGFSVSVVKDSLTARKNIEHSMPDLILADWNFEPSIFTKIDNLFMRMEAAATPHFIFYNVVDPSTVPQAKALHNVSFLGLTVSERDIFKVVTPLIAQAEAESVKDIQKSVQRCALEGEIAGGNLLEVLQFIEIGSKTGCLMIETKGPFGLVYFGDGRITYAAAATKEQGVEAVYAILNQPSGKFRFITNKTPKVANLNLPTLSVLMEWTKEKDEAHRG